MLTGKVYVGNDQEEFAPPAIVPAAMSVVGAGPNVNNVALPSFAPLKIMVWNIATLGGGIGYGPTRHNLAIAAMAKAISSAGADITFIIEVMKSSRPPNEPTFTDPRPTQRLDLSSRMDGVFNALVAGEAKFYRNYNLNNYHEFDDIDEDDLVKFIHDCRMEIFKGPGFEPPTLFLGKPPADFARQAELASAMQQLNASYTNAVENRVGPIADAKFIEFKQNVITRILPRLSERKLETLTEDETVEELLTELGVTDWWNDPDKIIRGPSSLDEFADLQHRRGIALSLLDQFLDQVVEEFEMGLVHTRSDLAKLRSVDQGGGKRRRRALDGDDPIIIITNALTHCINWRYQLQNVPAGRQARIDAYHRLREEWNAAQSGTAKHSGATELGRIAAHLGHLSLWPVVGQASVSDAGTDAKTIAPGDVSILYTENETYGVFYDPRTVNLRTINRLEGYQKRAPFKFEFIHIAANLDFDCLVWHAPSDGRSNIAARTANFDKLANDAAAVAKPTLYLADWNINTAAGNDIKHYTGARSASQFFNALSGHATFSQNSFFWDCKTTLKKSPVWQIGGDVTAPGPFGVSYQSRVSAFDKVIPRWPTCEGWKILGEYVLPLQIMLAEDQLRTSHWATPWTTLTDGDHPDLQNFLTSNLEGDMSALAHAFQLDTTFKLLAATIARSRLLSDHLPIVSCFEIPD